LFVFVLISVILSIPSKAQASEVAQLQALLNYAGYDAGPVDGVSGRQTVQALQNYFGDETLSSEDISRVLSLLITELDFEHLYEDAIIHIDDHVASSALLRSPLPSSTEIIRNYDRFRQYRSHYSQNYSWTGWLWNETSLETGETLDLVKCREKLLNFEAPTRPGPSEQDLVTCQLSYATQAVLDLDYGLELYGSLFLDMAYAAPDRWIYRRDPAHGRDNNPSFYHLGGIISTFMVFYAANIDQFDYSDADHERVYSFFRDKALQEQFNLDGDGRPFLCPINAPLDLTEENHNVNNCGTVRLRFAAAELALAIVGQDEILWRKGLWDLDYALSMINDEGFFVPTSGKGCRALGYLHDTSRLYSLNAEILAVAGFDLLSYITRHGVQMSDAYAMLYRQYEDVTISNHIARMGIGSASCGRTPYNTHEEFIIQDFGSVDNEWIPTFERSLNWSIRYVSDYKPEWLQTENLLDIPTEPFIGAYFTIQPFEIYFSNVSFEETTLWQPEQTSLTTLPRNAGQRVLSPPGASQAVGEWLHGHAENSEAYGLFQSSISFRDAQPREGGGQRLRFVAVVSHVDGSEVFNGRINYYMDDFGGSIGVDLAPIFESNVAFAQDWNSVVEQCGDSHEVYSDWVDIPVTKNDDVWMNAWDCIVQTDVSDQSKLLFASWIIIAKNIEQVDMRLLGNPD
jgi:peptidoglycan hydrolase-like protein with peptidoglycan-binding domain